MRRIPMPRSEIHRIRQAGPYGTPCPDGCMNAWPVVSWLSSATRPAASEPLSKPRFLDSRRSSGSCRLRPFPSKLEPSLAGIPRLGHNRPHPSSTGPLHGRRRPGICASLSAKRVSRPTNRSASADSRHCGTSPRRAWFRGAGIPRSKTYGSAHQPANPGVRPRYS